MIDVIIKNDDDISRFFATGESTEFLNGIIEGSVTHRNRRVPPKDMYFCLPKDLQAILKSTDQSGVMTGREAKGGLVLARHPGSCGSAVGPGAERLLTEWEAGREMERE